MYLRPTPKSITIQLTCPTESGVAPPIRILLPQMFFVSEASAATFLLRGLAPGEIWLAELEDCKSKKKHNFQKEDFTSTKMF